MNSFRRLLAVGWAVGWAASVAAPMCASANPLPDELASLLRGHPQIESSRKSLEAARAGVGVAKAPLYPQIQATGDIGPEVIDSPTTRSDDGDGDGASVRTRNVAGLSVTQNLFDGFATTSGVRIARLQRELASISLENTIQQTIFDGIRAYVDVLQQKRLIELARENEATIQRQLNLEDERVQRGSGVAVDVLQAKSRLQIAKERRVNFEGALKDAVSTYIRVFGHAPDIDDMMDPVPPIDLIPSDLGTAVEIALAENPAIGNSDTSVEVARERRRQVEAELFPSIDLEANANYEKHNNAVIGTRRDYSVVLSATWDLFTGFSTRRGQARANYEYRASRDDYELTRRRVVEQTKLAWQALLTAQERLELLENAVNIASEVFESRKKLREAGKETVINVLDAENEVNRAQIEFTSASYDERVAVYQLMAAMGRLDAGHLGLPLQ